MSGYSYLCRLWVRLLWRILCTGLNWYFPALPSPLSARANSLSSTPMAPSTTPLQHASTTEGAPLLTREPLTTFSSQPTQTVQDRNSTAYGPGTQPQSESVTTAPTQTTAHPLASAPGWGPAVPTHQEVPSELNVGDEGRLRGRWLWETIILWLCCQYASSWCPFLCHVDLKGPRYRSSSPLDPLLAGLLSVFIVTTAIVFVILFLKFRQRTNNPEFHRLQDLPMVSCSLKWFCTHNGQVTSYKEYSFSSGSGLTPQLKRNYCTSSTTSPPHLFVYDYIISYSADADLKRLFKFPPLIFTRLNLTKPKPVN